MNNEWHPRDVQPSTYVPCLFYSVIAFVTKIASNYLLEDGNSHSSDKLYLTICRLEMTDMVFTHDDRTETVVCFMSEIVFVCKSTIFFKTAAHMQSLYLRTIFASSS